MSPLSASAGYPFATSVSAISVVAFLVRAKISIAPKVSISRMRDSMSIFSCCRTLRKRCRMLGAFSLLTAMVISTGSLRCLSANFRICFGIVAEKSAVCRSLGVCSRIHSISSMNPILSISSASSSTIAFNCSSFMYFFFT